MSGTLHQPLLTLLPGLAGKPAGSCGCSEATLSRSPFGGRKDGWACAQKDRASVSCLALQQRSDTAAAECSQLQLYADRHKEGSQPATQQRHCCADTHTRGFLLPDGEPPCSCSSNALLFLSDMLLVEVDARRKEHPPVELIGLGTHSIRFDSTGSIYYNIEIMRVRKMGSIACRITPVKESTYIVSGNNNSRTARDCCCFRLKRVLGRRQKPPPASAVRLPAPWHQTAFANPALSMARQGISASEAFPAVVLQQHQTLSHLALFHEATHQAHWKGFEPECMRTCRVRSCERTNEAPLNKDRVSRLPLCTLVVLPPTNRHMDRQRACPRDAFECGSRPHSFLGTLCRILRCRRCTSFAVGLSSSGGCSFPRGSIPQAGPC